LQILISIDLLSHGGHFNMLVYAWDLAWQFIIYLHNQT